MIFPNLQDVQADLADSDAPMPMFDDEPTTPTSDIRHGVGQIARDVVTLAELQAQLLQVDLRNWAAGSLMPAAAYAAIALVAALASLPLLLLSLAYYLVEVASLTLPSALLIAAGIGLVVAALCATLAWRVMRRSQNAFTRFRVELARNVGWLKQVLGRPAATADSFSSVSASSAAPRAPR